MSQATQEPSESSPETTTAQIAEELGVFFFELPGSVATSFPGPAASAAAGAITGGVIPKKKNLVILQEHRDLLVKLEYPQNSSFRLYSPEKRFYDPLRKEQTDERLFASGEDVHLWLSKFHQPKIQLQRKGEDGQWEDYSFIDPAGWDTEDYSALAAKPAPIILKVGDPKKPLATSVKIPQPEMNIPADYQAELKRYHQAMANFTLDELLRKWETGKFPGAFPMPKPEEMYSRQAAEPEYTCFVELKNHTVLHQIQPNQETEHKLPEGYERAAADALVDTLGEVADKKKLVKDLTKTHITIVVKEINGSVKKFAVFSGYAATRHFLTGTRYSVDNVKVATITANQMTMGQLAATGAEDAKELFKPKTIAGKVAIIGLLMDTAEWAAKSHESGNYEFTNLLAKYTITAGTMVGLAFLTPFIAAGIAAVFGVVATSIGVVVLAGAAMVVIGYETGKLLRYLGAEKAVTKFYKEVRDAWIKGMESCGYNATDVQYFD